MITNERFAAAGQVAKVLSLKPRELFDFLVRAFRAGIKVLILGEPGSGKSSIVTQAVEAIGYDYFAINTALADPTDGKGLGWPNLAEGRADFLPLGDFAKILKAVKGTIVCLEDFGQSPNSVQAAFMPWLSPQRRCNDKILPDCVTFVATSNRRIDKSGVQGLFTSVTTRFDVIVNLEVSHEDWRRRAIEIGLAIETIAFYDYRPELFHMPQPNLDMVNYPNPRTNEALSKLTKLGLPSRLELPVYAGAVGEPVALEYVGFLKIWRELPSFDDIIMNPMIASIPESPSALYATAVGLASKATMAKSVLRSILKYAERMVVEKTKENPAGRGEYAALLVHDIRRRLGEKVTKTDEWNAFLTSDFGKLIYGIEEDD